MMKKKKHIVNWNIISLITAITVLVLSILLNYNHREIDILKSDLRSSEKLINKLESELDPSWHIKFKYQKDYYDNELKNKELVINEKNDLLIQLQSQNGLLLSREQKIEIVQTLIAYPLLLEEVKILEELNKSNEKIIGTQKEILSIRNSISEKENSEIYKSNIFLNIGLISFAIVGLTSAFMVYRKK